MESREGSFANQFAISGNVEVHPISFAARRNSGDRRQIDLPKAGWRPVVRMSPLQGHGRILFSSEEFFILSGMKLVKLIPVVPTLL